MRIGTWPIEPGQLVRVTYEIVGRDGARADGEVTAQWRFNEGPNSYWEAPLGPFADGDQVAYRVRGQNGPTQVLGPSAAFSVGPRLYLAMLWHQHQPIYKDTSIPTAEGSYLQPWVRLHALRDYYAMAHIAAHHDVHLTVNLSGSLLWQLKDYLEARATDRALELTQKRAETLTAEERQYVLSRFFDAHWHNQIAIHPRYGELFVKRRDRERFIDQDVRDVQMWFNLAWFGKEFREGEVRLVTGECASVRRFLKKGSGFDVNDVDAMVAEQFKVLRAVIPLHRELQNEGRIEVTTTPFAHPILPLIVDTDDATIDRPGTTLPKRFHRPEDADAQVELGVRLYESCFDRKPSGMWPAEGAVSASTLPLYARHGVRWIASDEGVLARSGRWGYDVGDPHVLCQAYRTSTSNEAVTMFFRETRLSNAIGFDYQSYGDYSEAAVKFVADVKERYARRLSGEGDYVLSVILDGENAWGAYRDDGRPFLGALYHLLAQDSEIRTVTFREYIEGNPARGIAPHSLDELAEVHELFTGSWIDEAGSAPGVDLGTWIGEVEENRAWELLGRTRDFLEERGASRETSPQAFEAVYFAEGSDWFWWFGDDQDSGLDEEFDDLFRKHLKNVYRAMGAPAPVELDANIVPHVVPWTHVAPVDRIQPGDRLSVRTHCPGLVAWSVDGKSMGSAPVAPVGGVMAGASYYQLTLGPFPDSAVELRFRFECRHEGCPGTGLCCDPRSHAVRIGGRL